MQFTLDDTTYDVDLDHISVLEMRQLKQNGGLTVTSLALGVVQGDVDALCAAVFLAKSRAGEKLRWSDLDSLDVTSLVQQLGTLQYKIVAVALAATERRVELLRAIADEIEAAEAAGEPVDPTPAELAAKISAS